MNIAILIPSGISMRREIKVLTEQGHTCRYYSFISTFIAGAKRNQFDLALVSWCLNGPRMAEVVRELRQIHGEDLPVILLDPPSNTADDEFLTQLGVDACHRKERDPNALIRCIERVMSQADLPTQRTEEEEEAEAEEVPVMLTLVS